MSGAPQDLDALETMALNEPVLNALINTLRVVLRQELMGGRHEGAPLSFHELLETFRNGPLRFFMEVVDGLGQTWTSESFTNVIMPRVGEYVQLDGGGIKVFKVEAVYIHAGNNNARLLCSRQSDYEPDEHDGWRRKLMPVRKVKLG